MPCIHAKALLLLISPVLYLPFSIEKYFPFVRLVIGFSSFALLVSKLMEPSISLAIKLFEPL